MKKLLILIFLLISFSNLWSQIKVADKAYIDSFLKSKTYIVLDENPFSVLNSFLDSSMKVIWKITPYEVITTDQFEQKMGDPKNSFLFISLARFTKTEAFDYLIINLSMGDASKNLNSLHDLCIIPLAYEDVDEDSYDYKFAAFIKFIQYFIGYSRQNSGKDLKQIVKENQTEVRKYELWVTANDMSPEINTLAKITKYYPFQVKIASKVEIQKAIEESNPKVAFLHKVGPEGTAGDGALCLKFILTAKEGKPLYFDNHKISSSKPDAFLSDDFKNLAK
jgi:hypothetical protein